MLKKIPSSFMGKKESNEGGIEKRGNERCDDDTKDVSYRTFFKRSGWTGRLHYNAEKIIFIIGFITNFITKIDRIHSFQGDELFFIYLIKILIPISIKVYFYPFNFSQKHSWIILSNYGLLLFYFLSSFFYIFSRRYLSFSFVNSRQFSRIFPKSNII